MMKRIACAALIVLAACGSTPTGSGAASGRWQADELVLPAAAPAPPQDTASQRVPNMMGSGN
jgi:uncharacterized lipoprotein YmbA